MKQLATLLSTKLGGDRDQHRLDSPRNFLIAASLIFALGLILRGWQFGSVPASLYWDEMAMLVDAKSVAQSGLDMHGNHWLQAIFPSYGDFKLPLYIWLAAIVVKLGGVAAWAVRLPSLLAGLASIGLAGVLTGELLDLSSEETRSRTSRAGLFNSRQYRSLAQLAAMLVIAISPWSITFSRTGFEGHLGQFLLGLSVWTMLRSRYRPWWGIIAAVLGAAATYAYFAVRFVWPAVLFMVMAVVAWRRFTDGTASLSPTRRQVSLKLQTLKSLAVHLILPLAVFGVLLLPMFRSPWYQPSNQFRLSTPSILNADLAIESNQLRELAGNTVIDRALFHRHWLLVRALLENVSDHLDASFIFLNGDGNLRHGTGQHGLYLAVMLPLMLIGLYYLGRHHWPAVVIVVGWWAWSLLPASVPLATPHALRSLNALLPTAIIIAAGLAAGIEFILIHKPCRRWIKPQAWLLLAGLALGVSVWQFGWHYFGPYPKLSGKWWQGGYSQLAEMAVTRRTQVDQVLVVEFDDRFHLWLMAHDDFTAADFHSWQSRGFKFRRFDNITIDQPGIVDDHLGSANSLVLIGLASAVDKLPTEEFRVEERLLIDDIPNQQPLLGLKLSKE